MAWYGGLRRRVAVVGESAHWHKVGKGLLAVRWVGVRDRTGTHRDEYFYATDPSLTPSEIIGYYCGRWNIETTFSGDAGALGAGDDAGRAVPVRVGLGRGIAVRGDARGERSGRIDWPGKATVTFSDALASVRRRTWSEGVLPQAGCGSGLAELPGRVRELLLTTLAPAA